VTGVRDAKGRISVRDVNVDGSRRMGVDVIKGKLLQNSKLAKYCIDRSYLIHHGMLFSKLSF
jgi:hypothetical protein